MTVKKDKLNATIMRELSDIIQNEVKNKEIGFCTITGVEITRDNSYAKVYVSFLSSNPQKKLDALERSKGFIRSALSKRLSIRRCPELIFVLDTSIEYGNKIDSILNKLNEEK
ncbi:MAG: 30S ribosome-binding factor RbfA [Erysipelotrichaceae bacterium]|nr:30S ribosome-binding factor RbfA [Erysipelotrichaceae bacterium]